MSPKPSAERRACQAAPSSTAWLRGVGIVAEAPPAFGDAEHQIDPARRALQLDQAEQAAGRQPSPQRAQGGVEIGGGVQDVGSDDRVERPVRALRRVEIERRRLQRCRVAEALLEVREEGDRKVAAHQACCRAAAKAGAGAVSAPVPEPTSRMRSGRVPSLPTIAPSAFCAAANGARLVDCRGTIECAISEQDLERLDAAGQDVRQRFADSPHQVADRALICRCPGERFPRGEALGQRAMLGRDLRAGTAANAALA